MYNLNAIRIIVNLALYFFYFINRSVTALHCYPEYCQNVTTLPSTSSVGCFLTRVEKSGDCSSLRFDEFNSDPPEDETAKFHLRAYVYKESESKATAFNLSIANVNFHGLITRYQNLLNNTQSACRYVQLYGNETRPPSTDFYVSCPFSDESYESVPYRLDYLVIGNGWKYTKRYIFNVPVHRSIDEDISIREYRPFVYIDVSHAPLLSLHVQPLPEAYNVSKYRIWLMNNDTNIVTYSGTFSTVSKEDIRYNFTAHTGVFYFKVSPVHMDCGEYGCANSTTPYIIIQEISHRLLIMIISTVWIPPVILYVLYHLYKLYRKETWKRKGTPKCLLVYSPTRLSHINVMVELAKYLRTCNINAMIDMLDVTDTMGQDVERWCDAAFRNADVILVASSPASKKPAISTIYRNTDNYLLRLITENRSRVEKRCYVVELPYCKPDDVPEETRSFARFCLPKELVKLVRSIYRMERVRCVSSQVSDKEFLDSVTIAKLEMLEEDVVKDKETENLLPLGSSELPDKRCSPLDTVGGNDASHVYATDLDELNLLGKGEESEREGMETCASRTSSGNETSLFRIDQLNL